MLSVGQVAAATQPKQGQLSPAGAPASTAQVVKIGFYPVSVYELDMGSNTYYVDMYVWLRWKGNIDPTGSLEFANMVEEWGKQVENLQSEPKVLPDGSKYQIMKVEGRFVQAFDLIDFPLDRQNKNYSTIRDTFSSINSQIILQKNNIVFRTITVTY